ncbi:sigma-70 family RNA polymerase sigma factor [Streptomyces candidus]|uniref:RNA polymerase sigma-70 factor (ECF subfamily) n=1 Tax=Streptomyces candidus TaxID=67283 RepID=A0A7X0LMZ5_9ACTN|nr:sigma-70 family RNA polymerase sigma factor [Streptomyces candidus]MBB6434322.1 RNA polymerase sigma-70 factor (ECF subfamily) [Streptomyces candidus]GHH37093.1 RNA polymerase sigma factor [Streptomyces candidus]
MSAITAAGTTLLAPTRAHARHVAPDSDGDAFIRDIYEQYGPLLLRYATRLLDGDWHKAEDILQETAARAWKNARYLRPRGEQIRPWLYTVARNLVIDHHRTRQIRPLELMPVEDLDASWDTTESALTAHALLRALRELTEQQRTVIRLMYYLECSVAQAAEHLGIPPGTVKSRAFYAVRALRRELEKQGVGGE